MKKIVQWCIYSFLIVHICLFLSGCGLLLLGAGTGAYIHGRNVEKEKNASENAN